MFAPIIDKELVTFVFRAFINLFENTNFYRKK